MLALLPCPPHRTPELQAQTLGFLARWESPKPGELIPPGMPMPCMGPFPRHKSAQQLPPRSPPGRHGQAKSHPCQRSCPADVAAAGPTTRH